MSVVIARRFTIHWDPFGSVGTGGYRVSIPNYDGGEVVVAEDYDALSRQLAGAVEAMQRAYGCLTRLDDLGPDVTETAVDAARMVLAQALPLDPGAVDDPGACHDPS